MRKILLIAGIGIILISGWFIWGYATAEIIKKPLGNNLPPEATIAECPEGQEFKCWDGWDEKTREPIGGCMCGEIDCQNKDDCSFVYCPPEKYPVCKSGKCACEKGEIDCLVFRSYLEKSIENVTGTSCESDKDCYVLDLPDPWCYRIVSSVREENKLLTHIEGFTTVRS